MIFAGDTHGDLSHLAQVPDGPILHVGDFAPLEVTLSQILPTAAHDRFWFIPGNHDFDDARDERHLLADPVLSGRNFHGRVVEIGGLRVAGLGKVFKGRVWYPRDDMTAPTFNSEADYRRHLPPRDRKAPLSRKVRAAIWPEEYEALAKCRADVLVTHEAPTSHPHGFAAIDALARRLGVKLVVHGHHHMDCEGHTADGIDVIGVGLRGLRTLSGTILKPGEQDS